MHAHRAFVTGPTPCTSACRIFGHLANVGSVDAHTDSPNRSLFTLLLSMCVFFFSFGNWQTLELCLCAYICVVQAMNRYSAPAFTDDMRRETRRTGITTTTTATATISDAIKMKTNKLHRKALYGNTYFGTIEKVCVHWNAVRRFCKQQKKGKEKNNMFKSLMAYETKRCARVPESVSWWRCSAPRKKKKKTATT